MTTKFTTICPHAILVTEDRIKTYIEGFDEMLEGGVPKGNIVLVRGAPGTMKTTFCYHIIHYNAREEDRTGVYVTLEQSKVSLLRGLESFGFEYDATSGKTNIQDLAWIRKRSASPWKRRR